MLMDALKDPFGTFVSKQSKLSLVGGKVYSRALPFLQKIAREDKKSIVRAEALGVINQNERCQKVRFIR